MKHPLFISRTVLVKNGNVENSVRLLNRILGREGIIKDIGLNERYEKPWQTRRRVNYERCRAICNEEMNRKVKFLLRKNRPQAYPGC